MEYKNIKTEYPLIFKTKEGNKPLFISGVIDGEDININKGKVSIIKRSESRIDNGCKYQDICGGCQFMHTTYDYEIETKKKYLENLFKDRNHPILFLYSRMHSLARMSALVAERMRILLRFPEKRNSFTVTFPLTQHPM